MADGIKTFAAGLKESSVRRSTETIAEALELVRRIKARSVRGGWADTDALHDTKHLIHQLRNAAPADADFGYWGEKLGSIESWADVLFSARKHERWGGHAQVRHLLLCDCARLRMVLRTDATRRLPSNEPEGA
jgi:hypothetical protein